MKQLITIILLTFAWFTEAANWPDTVAPCNTTLQACVDGVAEYETIFINTSTVIDESISAIKSVSLVAGNGYRPVFAAGRHVELTHVANSNRTTRIEGLTFERGRIAYNHQSGSTTGGALVIRNNRVLDNAFQFESIRILNFSNQTLTLNVDYNQVHYTATSGSSNSRGAIRVQTGFSPTSGSSGVTFGRIYGNSVFTAGPDSIGIGLFTYADTELSLDVGGNEVWGGQTGGLFSFSTGGTALVDLDIGNNAFYANAVGELFRGVFLQSFAGTTSADIVNNTALGAFDAFNFDESTPGALDVYLYNNLMAYGSAAVYTDSQTTLTNDFNLSYMNSFSDPDFIPGPNHLNVNPEIMGLHNGRLRPGSPALEAGNGLALLALGATPFVDADGTSRIKKGDASVGAQLVDIGAYESGDLFFNHVTNSAGHISTMDNDAFNDNSALDNIHVTANWNPPGGSGVYNNDHEGIYYASGFWRIFNQGFTAFEPNATFNVHQYGNTSNTIEHTASGGNNNTVIDHSSLNNQSDRIVQVTQNWIGEYNPHPVGVLYFSGSWLIANFDLANIPANSHFNVYSQPPSKSAFKHVASAANTFDQVTYLDHPLINGVACAELQVTQSGEQGVFNDAPIGVYYEAGSWSIYNQDLSDMLPNSAFHIMVNPAQIAECTDLIYADDFQ
ncbi:DUF7452 domain-containing protein [Marinicella meishanensis]|uniref:DUF7452 domain-containing protein n=1 Tax=Marinicella meishanensis TaxID=2873263 RepID=UPI001CBBB640|nr:choice-of-anchor Q domain-containing protein [Marinicella sp. NBU2979]